MLSVRMTALSAWRIAFRVGAAPARFLGGSRRSIFAMYGRVIATPGGGWKTAMLPKAEIVVWPSAPSSGMNQKRAIIIERAPLD